MLQQSPPRPQALAQAAGAATSDGGWHKGSHKAERLRSKNAKPIKQNKARAHMQGGAAISQQTLLGRVQPASEVRQSLAQGGRRGCRRWRLQWRGMLAVCQKCVRTTIISQRQAAHTITNGCPARGVYDPPVSLHCTHDQRWHNDNSRGCGLIDILRGPFV